MQQNSKTQQGQALRRASAFAKASADRQGKAWVATVDMGYGHQRTAYALRHLAFYKVINANSYRGIPEKDKKFWRKSRSSYEFISRFRSIPLVGAVLFILFDSFQKIVLYYPKRDLSKLNLAGRAMYHFINRGWGRDLIEKFKTRRLPLVSTFFSIAFMAEEHAYRHGIYCVICDADIARAWAPKKPKTTIIRYFASTTWARDRLKLYGVPAENIALTGYPLPKENIGNGMEIVKKDTGYRLINLDPRGQYRKLYAPLIKNYLGELPALPNHPLTLLFSIGGAGAQKEIALTIMKSLQKKLQNGALRLVISVGVRQELRPYFEKQVKALGVEHGVDILWGSSMNEYFERFNKALRTTDVLLTKPSELSFYAGLGIPIIIQPSIGSQEDFNRKWLMHIGCATLQENPQFMDEWFFDQLNSGQFAEMAMQGFVEVEKMGTHNIEKIIAQQ